MIESGNYNRDDEEGDGIHHARVVVDALDDAIEASALDDVRAQFPPDSDRDELFALAEHDTDPIPPKQRPD